MNGLPAMVIIMRGVSMRPRPFQYLRAVTLASGSAVDAHAMPAVNAAALRRLRPEDE